MHQEFERICFHPDDLLDIETILFPFDVQKDFAMIANEDAKDKLSAINDFVDSAVIGRTLMIVLIENVKVCEKTGQLIYNVCVQFSCKGVYWLRQAYKIKTTKNKIQTMSRQMAILFKPDNLVGGTFCQGQGGRQSRSAFST